MICDEYLERAGLEPAPTEETSLCEIIRQFKTFSVKRINKQKGTQGVPLWQRNYYEHVIRTENELNEIRNYIKNNPMNWNDDSNFSNNYIQ